MKEVNVVPKNSSEKGKAWVYSAVIVVVVVIIIIGILAYRLSAPSGKPSSTPTPHPSTTPITSPSPASIPLMLYVANYGYGNSADSITSPGPTLQLNVGETYTMTIYNVGGFHSWEIVPTQAIGTPLFEAEIGIFESVQSMSVTFTPDQTGNFYYVCTVFGHIGLGMWGNVIVS
jgi:hypothetical protein